jgi:hypothetical protein
MRSFGAVMHRGERDTPTPSVILAPGSLCPGRRAPAPPVPPQAVASWTDAARGALLNAGRDEGMIARSNKGMINNTFAIDQTDLRSGTRARRAVP